jgi:hypothetical protein
MEKGWHTYWRNPGDSGLPTTLDWKLPTGIAAGRRVARAALLPAGPHELRLRRRKAAAGNDHRLTHADAGATEVLERTRRLAGVQGGSFPKADHAVAAGGEIVGTRCALGRRNAATRGRCRPLAGWQVAQGRGQTIEMHRALPALRIRTLQFYPYAEAKIEPSVPQKLRREGGVRLRCRYRSI